MDMDMEVHMEVEVEEEEERQNTTQNTKYYYDTHNNDKQRKNRQGKDIICKYYTLTSTNPED